jgi:Flp pilus assembly protein TadD
LNWARILDSRGEYEEALAESHEAVRRDPSHAAAWNHFGARLWRAGRMDEARAAFTKAIELSPQYGAALLNAARAALEGGDVREAQALAARARRADPTLPGLAEVEGRAVGP